MEAVGETSIKAFNITKCLICLEAINDSNLLSCFHAFCVQCLNNYCSANIESNDEFECPLCSRIFLIPRDGINCVTNNFFTNRLLVLDKSSGLLSLKETLSLCELCSDAEVEISSTSYCVECDQRICDRCSASHTKARVSRSHQVIRDENNSTTAEPERIVASASCCDQHPSEEQRLYCYDCKMVMCHKCTRKPDKHALSEVTESKKKFCKQLTENVEKLSAYACQEQDFLIQLETDKKNFLKTVDVTRGAIFQKYEQLVSLLQAQRSQLMNELNEFKIKVLREMETKKRKIERQFIIRENFARFCVAMMDKETTCDISCLTRDIHARFEKLVNIPEEPDRRKLSEAMITFKPSPSTTDSVINFFGELIFDSQVVDARCEQPMRLTKLLDKSKLLHDKGLQTRVTGVTVINSYVFVVSKSSHIDVYRCDDFSLSHKLLITGSKQLKGVVSCSHYNCLYICDHTLAIIHRYDLASNGTSNWSTTASCCALSVTRIDHNVLATLYCTQHVEEYTTHGCLVRVINLHSSMGRPHHCIQLSTGNYVVSHSGNWRHRVCLIDRSGRMIESFGESFGRSQGRWKLGLSNPGALATDAYDNVLVADSLNNRVLLLSATLAHLGDIVMPTVSLRFPSTLCVDDLSHRLYIGERNTAHVISHVIVLEC